MFKTFPGIAAKTYGDRCVKCGLGAVWIILAYHERNWQ